MADTSSSIDRWPSPAAALEHVRDTLQTTVCTLTGLPGGRVDPVGLLSTAREIQRLVDATITELTAMASSDPASPPLETLLSGDGAIPRSQIQAEIDRVRIHDTFPAIAQQTRAGTAHTANIDALARLTRNLNDTELAAMADHDEALADAAGRLSDDSFRKRVTRLRNKIRSDSGTTAAQQIVDDSYARITPTADRDAHRLTALLDPIRGATVAAALAREAKYLTEHPELCIGLTSAQVAAQALHDLIVRGDAADHSFLPRPSVQIHVLTDWDTLETGPHAGSIAETFDGAPIGTATLDRLCCDATMRRIATTPDANVHVARSARSPSVAQRAALRALYPNCPISGAGWESIEIHQTAPPVRRRSEGLRSEDVGRRPPQRSRARRPVANPRPHLSHPDGTPFRTIAPPTPINQRPTTKNDHDLAA